MATTEIQLLGAWASPFANRVQIALNLKSVQYKFIEENLYNNKSDRLLRANPVHKKIPVLIHDDAPICESLVIVQYIDETWDSGPTILPSDPYDRAIARFWAAYIDDTWWPLLKQHLKAADDATLERLVEGMDLLEAAFAKCSKGKAFFGGDEIGYLDIALGCYIGWIQVVESRAGVKLIDEARTVELAKWVDRVRSHSAAKDVIPSPHKLTEFYMVVKAARDEQASK